MGLQTFLRYYSRYIGDVFAIQLANCDIDNFLYFEPAKSGSHAKDGIFPTVLKSASGADVQQPLKLNKIIGLSVPYLDMEIAVNESLNKLTMTLYDKREYRFVAGTRCQICVTFRTSKQNSL